MLNSVASPKIPVERMFVGVAPFFLVDLVVLGLLLGFPILSLWMASAI